MSLFFAVSALCANASAIKILRSFDFGGPRDMVLGPDGAMWFLGYENSKYAAFDRIYRISLNGKVESTRLDGPRGDFDSDTNAIAVGSDAKVWVAKFGNIRAGHSTIYRVQPGGGQSHFTLKPKLKVLALAAGPDDRMWFIGNHGRVGAVSQDGHVTIFLKLKSKLKLVNFVQGPDRAMWAVGGFGVMRISASGSVRKFNTEWNFAPDISLGADHNLWLTANKGVIRMTPRGKKTFFPLGFPSILSSSPYDNPDTPVDRMTFGVAGNQGGIAFAAGMPDADNMSDFVSSASIGVMAPGGAVSESRPENQANPRPGVFLYPQNYPAATAGERLLAVGRDQSLWLTLGTEIAEVKTPSKLAQRIAARLSVNKVVRKHAGTGVDLVCRASGGSMCAGTISLHSSGSPALHLRRYALLAGTKLSLVLTAPPGSPMQGKLDVSLHDIDSGGDSHVVRRIPNN